MRLRQVIIAVVKQSSPYRGLRKIVVVRDRRLYRQPTTAIAYLFRDSEIDNFTYDIANRDELSSFVADATAIPLADAERFVDEADASRAPKPLGRRLGWYAIVRALQPDLVYETGTHGGLGSLAIASALRENGHGRLITFDIDPRAGEMLTDRLPVELIVGDTRETLRTAIRSIGRLDIFLHDSAHTYEHRDR